MYVGAEYWVDCVLDLMGSKTWMIALAAHGRIHDDSIPSGRRLS
jgi:hypothetical protein